MGSFRNSSKHWTVYRSFDWGYHRPFSCGWWAVDPDGVAYRILEFYGCTGVDDMGEAAVPIVLGVVPEFFEELALVYVPAAVEPGLPQLRRELFQGTQIFRLAFHQGPVVRAQGLDKIPVDEQPLEVAVGRPAGIQGVVGPFGEGIDAPDAGVDLHQPLLLELPCLIGKPNVVFAWIIARV